jgi:superfamily II DNA or RNA helicase
MPPPHSSTYCAIIREKSYLGRRGYAIPLTILSSEDHAELKEELTMQPFVNSAYSGKVIPKEQMVKFPVFHYGNENKRIYIPRFYGIERYGLPNKIKIASGESISCTFTKTLRDYQEKIVQSYLTHTQEGAGGGILEIYCGAGKTIMALYLVSILRKKTLILVHKEFLMNQWIERIREFLPTATIGTIQGDTFDVVGKDIVIGMIQTMYKRDFGDVLQCFGLTIIDEVHRIGSEEFSKTLLNVSTEYMLGISATVERKDRLTKLLYMFIGPKIYSLKKEGTDTVQVRAITYDGLEDELCKPEYFDFRGKPKYSTMISKLCSYESRSRFILNVLRDLIAENDKAQIIVLCHNICLLDFFYNEMSRQPFATFGYYKGGMKKDALKASEDKQIILGSYAMASEGLDIPTLATLVLATPKTDIVQCVGRILRVKQANPIIVDIVDNQDVFLNQWRRRRAYYKKCNYSIFMGTRLGNCVPLHSSKHREEEEDKVDDVCMIDMEETS